MLDILQFTFQSFWHFVGVTFLMAFVFSGAIRVIRAAKGKP